MQSAQGDEVGASGPPSGDGGGGEGLEASPQYRIVDGCDGAHRFEITYDVSGFRPADVKITLESGGSLLVVTAKKEEKRGKSTVAREFRRQLEIPNSVDSSAFECLWDAQGHLRVSAPLKFAPSDLAEPAPKPKERSLGQQCTISRQPSLSLNPTHTSNENKSAPASEVRRLEPIRQISAQGSDQKHSAKGHSAHQKSTHAESEMIHGPRGSFLYTTIPITPQLGSAKETQIRVNERAATVTLHFCLEDSRDGWSETRRVSKTHALPACDCALDWSGARALLDAKKLRVTLAVPAASNNCFDLKEIHIKF